MLEIDIVPVSQHLFWDTIPYLHVYIKTYGLAHRISVNLSHWLAVNELESLHAHMCSLTRDLASHIHKVGEQRRAQTKH